MLSLEYPYWINGGKYEDHELGFTYYAPIATHLTRIGATQGLPLLLAGLYEKIITARSDEARRLARIAETIIKAAGAHLVVRWTSDPCDDRIVDEFEGLEKAYLIHSLPAGRHSRRALALLRINGKWFFGYLEECHCGVTEVYHDADLYLVPAEPMVFKWKRKITRVRCGPDGWSDEYEKTLERDFTWIADPELEELEHPLLE